MDDPRGGAPKGRKKGRHPENALTVSFVRAVAKPGRYCDGNGLYLQVDPSGARRWVQRLRVHGRDRTLGLGGCALVPLAEARAKALDNRRLARAGGDPLARGRAAAGVPSFADAAQTVCALHRPSWRSAKHAAQWLTTLERYAFPRLGARPVSAVDTADVMAVLTPIWHRKPATAQRVRQRIGKVMLWAVAQGWRADNPAGEAVGAALPRRNGAAARHFPALPHGEVAAALAALRASGARPAVRLALEFLVLTAARSGEVRAAEWREMDRGGAVWSVPAERMKSKRAHRVPLAGRALEVLAEARALDDGELVFPGARRGRPLSDSTLLKTLRALGLDTVVHGFRSSFRDWAAERTDAPHAVMEAALAHAVRDRAEAAYARTDLFGRRRALMERWAVYVSDNPDARIS